MYFQTPCRFYGACLLEPIVALKCLADQVKLTVIIDQEVHIETLSEIRLENERNRRRRWPVLIEVKRGAPVIARLTQVLEFLAENHSLELRGFYCEATELWGPLPDRRESLVEQQMESVMAVVKLGGDHTPLILSIEATTSDDLAYFTLRGLFLASGIWSTGAEALL